MNSTVNTKEIRKIKLADSTIRSGRGDLSFKEKLETVRTVGKLGIDIIEFGAIEGNDAKADSLLCRTAAALIEDAVLSVTAGADRASADAAWAAVSGAKKPRIAVALPISTVQAEYTYHKKPDAMIDVIAQAVKYAASLCRDVEFRAVDATRADGDVLERAVRAAVENGAATITVCDTAGRLLPAEAADIVRCVADAAGKGIAVGIECCDRLGMATSSSVAAAAAGADEVKTAFTGTTAPTCAFAAAIAARGEDLGIKTDVDTTSLAHTAEKIARIPYSGNGKNNPFEQSGAGVDVENVPADSSAADIDAVISRLGYDLSADDRGKVYESFVRLAKKSGKKSITPREIDAIVASNAMQVPPTYRLSTYVINSGNTISSTAHIALERDSSTIDGLGCGDGPIDAAFTALESIIGYHYELDDFELRSVTEGREAMGEALVRLRYNGRLYSGKGLSTDVIGAAIRAYVAALNKIVYEQNSGEAR